jgi:uncharacterized protein
MLPKVITHVLRLPPDDNLIEPGGFDVRDSSISGRGLFAAKVCYAGEALLIISGELIDQHEALRRERAEGNWYIYWNHDRQYIDTAYGRHGRYLNHSCAPNTITAPRDKASLYLVAVRDIAPGEELTLDYDYDEIYDICRRYNAGCLRDACPRAAAPLQGDQS